MMPDPQNNLVARIARTWPGLLALMFLRLVLLGAALLLMALLLPGDSAAFYTVIALAYIVSIPYALWLKNSEKVRDFLPLQFLVDLVVVTGVVYFTGGIASELTMLYPLVILSAGVVTTPLRAIQVTVLCMLAYVTLIVLVAQGVLYPFGGAAPYADWRAVARVVALRLLVFACFGGASLYVSRRCNYADRRIERFREMTEIIFRNVGAGLVLTDEQGLILMVNDHACRHLGCREEQMLGSPLSNYLIGNWVTHQTQQEDRDVTQCFFRRADGSTFPVSFEIGAVTLPAEAYPGRREGMLEAAIIAFTDVSPIIEMQQQLKSAERIKAAANIAAEIAHEIRNPLAAISGAVQVIQRLERRALLGDERVAELLTVERRKAFDQIIRDAARLDKIIERFINFTEFTPEALARLERYLDTSAREQDKIEGRFRANRSVVLGLEVDKSGV